MPFRPRSHNATRNRSSNRLSIAEADALYRNQEIMDFLRTPSPARRTLETPPPHEAFMETFRADETALKYRVERVERYYHHCAKDNRGNLVGDLVQAFEIADKYFVGASDVAGPASSPSFPGAPEADVAAAREALEPLRRRLVKARQGFIQDHEWDPILRDARIVRQGAAPFADAGEDEAVDDECGDESWGAAARSRGTSRRLSRKFSFEEIQSARPANASQV